MPVFAVLLIIAVTVCINAFVTAFLMVRFQQSEKNIRRLKLETDVITRDVNRATEAHVALAQAAAEQLEQVLAEYKALSKKDRKISGSGGGAKTRAAKVLAASAAVDTGAKSFIKNQAKPLAAKPARAENIRQNIRQNIKQNSLPNAQIENQQNVQQQILHMLREGRSEDEIQKIYNISKAEIALARFMQSAGRQA